MTSNFLAPSQKLFFSRNNPEDPRLGELAKPIADSSSEQVLTDDFVIVGYPDDEGISLNGGRPGAQLGPDAIRSMLYKMTPRRHQQRHQRRQQPLNSAIYDEGNLKVENASLEERHQQALQKASSAHQRGARILSFGGGHDYGYPDGAAFLQHNKQKPLIINFDAHLDVRPTDNGLSSGTPFFRLLNEFQDFDFAQIGIQSHCNSQAHYQWCEDNGARIVTAESLLVSAESFATQVCNALDDWIVRSRPCFISIDIDGFSSSYAMGCSQAWPTGFLPHDFFPLLEILLKRLDVRALGIYEVSPPLDSDHRTAKLAAQIAHQYLFSNQPAQESNTSKGNTNE